MSTQRYISTSFWDDAWIQELDPSEKLLYIYLMTNPLTNIAGVYKITRKRMCFDTGFNSDTVGHILTKFEKAGKAFTCGEYLIIRSFPNHQKWDSSEKIKRGIDSILMKVPPEVIVKCAEVGYTYNLAYVIDTLSIPYDYTSNYLNLNLNLNLDLNKDKDKNTNLSEVSDKPSTPEEKTTISCSEILNNSTKTSCKVILDNSTEKDKSSTPEVKKTKSKNSKSLLFDKINEFTQDEKLRSILNDYLKFKLSHSRGYDIKQWVMQLDALRGFSKGDTETAYRQVALAYSSGWQSLVYLDNNKKTAYKPKDVNAFEALEKEHEMNYDDNNNDGIPIF